MRNSLHTAMYRKNSNTNFQHRLSQGSREKNTFLVLYKKLFHPFLVHLICSLKNF